VVFADPLRIASLYCGDMIFGSDNGTALLLPLQ
jgi:hypothetical protein